MHLGAALYKLAGGRATGWLSGTIILAMSAKLRMPVNVVYSSETVGDKLHSREGNSPDRRLRPLRVC
jgi:hypothetical protein